MTYKSHYIVTSDLKGKRFFYTLIKRIRVMYHYPEIDPQVSLVGKGGDGGFNEIDERIQAGLTKKEFIIVFMDGDYGKNKKVEWVKQKMSGHSKVELLIFESEVEEWVLKGTNKPFVPGKKASVQMKEHYPEYTKASLPNYASKIDLEILKIKDENFKRFLVILDP
ncbi:MAG: hypothetical protein WAX07_05460 [Candidatus Altiarchaeia archaeon]